MKKATKLRISISMLLLVVVGYGVYSFRDEINARIQGSPIILISSTKSINPNKDEYSFVHIFFKDGNLRLVVRDEFYYNYPFARPYLVVNDKKEGFVHIGTKLEIHLAEDGCIHTRQVELEMPSKQWKSLTSIQVYNDNREAKIGDVMPIGNSTYLTKLLNESLEKIVMEDLKNTKPGCGA